MLELPKKALLRPDEVAKWFSINIRTVYLWVEQGELEAIKIAGTLRIKRKSVLNCKFDIKVDE